MSRSVKRISYYGERKNKFYKHLYNRQTRRKLNRDFNIVVSYKNYRKIFESWDICEYKRFDILNFHYYCKINELEPTKENYKYYHKYYRRK